MATVSASRAGGGRRDESASLPLPSGVPACAGTEPDTSSVWHPAADLPLARAGMASGWIDNRFVVAGGSHWVYESKRWSDSVDVYDPDTGRWDFWPPMTEPLADAAYASDSRSLYVMGGYTGTAVSRKCWRFSHVEEGTWRWERLPDLPRGRTYASAVLLGRRLCFLGGCADPRDLRTATSEAFSLVVPDGRAWQPLPPIPGPARAIAAAATDGRAVYLFGGGFIPSADTVTSSAESCCFDPVAWAWRRLRPLPRAVRGLRAIGLPDGRIGIFGGFSAEPEGAALSPAGGFERQVLRFDPARDEYREGAPLPFGVIGMAVGVRRGRVMLTGGEDFSRSRSATTLTATVDGLFERKSD